MLLAQLELERDNLTVALEWADNNGAGESLLRLVTALALFWVLRGHTADGGRWFGRALAHDDGPSVVRARALWGAAYVAIYGDDHETGDLCAPLALTMARDLNDPWTMARATNAYNYVALWKNPAQARADLARGVEMARSIGDWFAVADGLKMSTIAWQVEDDHDGGAADSEELLAVAKRLDNKFYEAWYHNFQALGALRRGEVVRARDECERSLELCRAVGDPSTAGVTIAWLGEVEALTGQHEEARARFETFLQRARATGGDQGFPFALINLMTLLVGCGEADTAALLLGPLVAEVRDDATRLPMIFAWALAVYGSALAESDEPGSVRGLDRGGANCRHREQSLAERPGAPPLGPAGHPAGQRRTSRRSPSARPGHPSRPRSPAWRRRIARSSRGLGGPPPGPHRGRPHPRRRRPTTDGDRLGTLAS